MEHWPEREIPFNKTLFFTYFLSAVGIGSDECTFKDLIVYYGKFIGKGRFTLRLKYYYLNLHLVLPREHQDLTGLHM